jgi:DNA-binding response OmpR family regulator
MAHAMGPRALAARAIQTLGALAVAPTPAETRNVAGSVHASTAAAARPKAVAIPSAAPPAALGRVEGDTGACMVKADDSSNGSTLLAYRARIVLRGGGVMSSASGFREGEGERLGGARADFVASLGRKVAGARELLSALGEDPSSKPLREELRRRLHALGSGARLLRFEAMARSLQETLAVLDRAVELGEVPNPDIAFATRALDALPALAWDASAHDAGSGPGVLDAPAQLPATVLLIGEAELERAFGDAAGEGRAFECERTEDVASALQLARAYAPELVVIDVDLRGAPPLVSALIEDPLTEPVPIVVVGTFRTSDEASRFAALGVARTLAKPVAPQVVRTTCEEVLDGREGRTQRMTLGEPTLEQLAERLADELKGALLDTVDVPARSCRVPLGEGSEVLGALWGTIARVQEIVTQKTAGAIRFSGGTPEGAIALAPWLPRDVPASDRGLAAARSPDANVSMTGRRVVVADDDPGVTWFISDLLRTAGCEVYEALDGLTALELAFQTSPDLVVSDILMPGLDGFALSRALRRDVALRDTPVILLSWKEDLLQRVRELGASAAAYMRKETDSRAILARVREVLRSRARVEARLRAGGEVRGRLDGLYPRLLLELVSSIRRDARIDVRDASFLYEIEVRQGAPRKATRTASDGSYQSGERILASLLGVGAGRFAVSPASEPVRGDLTGTLAEQLSHPIAAARGALAATTGAATMHVERIGLDSDGLEEYLRATPDPARTLIRQLAAGGSPRRMLLDGEVSPSLLEDVLADLAARGVIRSVEGPGDTDLLSPRVAAALATSRTAPPSAQRWPSIAPARAPREPAPSLEAAPPPSLWPAEGATQSAVPPEGAIAAEETASPSSLEDAVMREISDRSPFPGSAQTSAPELPPIVEPSELRPRSSNPPEEDAPLDVTALPSIPPDAIVPDTHGPEAMSLDFGSEGPQTPLLPTLVDLHARAETAARSATQTAPETSGWAEPQAGPPALPRTLSAVESPRAAARRSGRGLVLASLAFFVLCVAVAAALYLAGGDALPSWSPAVVRPAGP